MIMNLFIILLAGDLSLIVYLYGPVTVLVLSNLAFFLMTIVCLYKDKVNAESASDNKKANKLKYQWNILKTLPMSFVFIIFDLLLYRIRFRTILSLFMLMGVSWVMEIVSFWVGGSAYIWIPTDILNILTGVFVFVILVCKRRIWKSLKNRIIFMSSFNLFLFFFVFYLCIFLISIKIIIISFFL